MKEKERKREREKKRKGGGEIEGREGENGGWRKRERKKESGFQIVSQISRCMTVSRYLERSPF